MEIQNNYSLRHLNSNPSPFYNGCLFIINGADMPRKGQLNKRVLTEIQSLLARKGLILSEYFGVNRAISAYCKKHGEITIRAASLRKGSGCKRCANERISEKYTERGKRKFLDRLSDTVEALSSTYVDSTTPMLLYCKIHSTEYTQTPRDYTAGWRGCPKCKRISLGETKVLNYLVEHNITYKREHTFKDCMNPETTRRLPFDFYLDKLGVLIEYDGEQHFKEIPYFRMSLQERKYLDDIKTEWAKVNKMKLIRVPYWDFDNIEVILNKHLRSKT